MRDGAEGVTVESSEEDVASVIEEDVSLEGSLGMGG
jgi:hypothetical protein